MRISMFILFTFILSIRLSAATYHVILDDESEYTEDEYENGFEDNDILLGRGGLTNNHYGNKEYRKVIKVFKADYRKLRKKADKADVVRHILDLCSYWGARFMKFNELDGLWEEVDYSHAYGKTSQALRED